MRYIIAAVVSAPCLAVLCASLALCRAWSPAPPSIRSSIPTFARPRRRSIVTPLSEGAGSPPVPFRDDASFLLAGDVPHHDASSPPPIRQSASSTNPLLSPPRRIPNPYGWMRDDSRTNATVLEHLKAENEYGRRMTEHLEGLRDELYHEVSWICRTCSLAWWLRRTAWHRYRLLKYALLL